jgi:hypothetical protein
LQTACNLRHLLSRTDLYAKGNIEEAAQLIESSEQTFRIPGGDK